MSIHKLRYGEHPLTIDLKQEPDQRLSANPIPAVDSVKDAFRKALQNPIGTEPLYKLVSPSSKVAIIVSDRYRVFPKRLMLEAVLQELTTVPNSNITIIVGNGNHNPEPLETHGYTDEQLERFRWIQHESRKEEDMVDVGTTEAGTPVALNCHYMEADIKIAIGQVKAHYIVGYSGGAKSVLPAVAAITSIYPNHAHKVMPRSRLGIIRDNPTRLDMEDAAQMAGHNFIFNVVLNSDKGVVAAVAGDVIQAHRQSVSIARSVAQIPAEKTDIVIISERMPIARNLYQLCKLGAPGGKCLKENGVLILAGQCREGLGDMPDVVNVGIFQMGIKNYIPESADVLLVTEMPEHDNEIQAVGTPVANMDEALRFAYQKCGKDATLTLIPAGGDIAPYTENDDIEDWKDDIEKRLTSN